MSEQDNTRIAEKSLMSINSHNLNQEDDLFAQDYLNDTPGAQGPLNREQSSANTQVFIDAFPDLHFEVVRRIAQGDFVVLNWVSTGTHTGPLRTPSGNTVPATGKKGKIYGSTTYELRDGKITHTWVYWDMAAMLAQLGLLPPM